MHFTRETYQGGCLTQEPRAKGDVWAFRWRETGPFGKTIHRKIIVGTVRALTQAAAKRAVEAMNLQINTNQPRRGPITVAELIAHYTVKELGKDRKTKTPYTCDVYRQNLANHVEPRWGSRRADSINAPEVEDWLGTLSLANGTKAKLRNNMSAVWNHGIRHQLVSTNPIVGSVKGSGVRQSSKRQSDPVVLTEEELSRGLAELPTVLWTMVLLVSETGLRSSEQRGLKNGDLDAENLKLNLRRGVVKGYLGDMKNNASRKPVSITPEICKALQDLRSESAYPTDNDWMFPSITAKGRVPLWANSALVDHIRPAFARAGIDKHVTWRTLRTSFATILHANGESVKTLQESLRHSTSAMSLDVYAQPIPADVRSAQLRLASKIVVQRPTRKVA